MTSRTTLDLRKITGRKGSKYGMQQAVHGTAAHHGTEPPAGQQSDPLLLLGFDGKPVLLGSPLRGHHQDIHATSTLLRSTGVAWILANVLIGGF